LPRSQTEVREGNRTKEDRRGLAEKKWNRWKIEKRREKQRGEEENR
jgi:hypothetical protein